MSGISHAVYRGLGALTKSILLVVGVPIALWRLWFLAPAIHAPITFSELASVAGGVHLVLVVVAGIWFWATVVLARELVGALRRGDDDRSDRWSHRWAGAIVGLFLAIGAGSIAVTSSAIATRPAVTALPRTLADRPPTAPAVPSHSTTVRAGECLADVAARALGDQGQWPALFGANAGMLQADGTRVVDPNLLRPGWCLDTGAEVAPPVGEDLAASPGSHHGANHSLAELSLLGLGSLITAAVARRVRALRAIAESGRALGTYLDSPPGAIAALDTQIAPFGESRLIDWIEAALRLAGAGANPTNPDLRLVRAGPAGVELLLAEPDPSPPPPMTMTDGGRWWVLPASDLGEPAAIAPAAGRVAPWLVPVGEDVDAVYLVGVGPGRRLVIDGPPEEMRAVARGLVAGLRGLPWAAELEVELIGIEPPPARERCFQLFASTPATLLDIARRGTGDASAASRPRWRKEPLVVAIDGAAFGCDEALFDQLAPLVGIVSDTGEGTERLVLDGEGAAMLLPYRIALCPPHPSTAQGERLDRLFEAAADAAALVRPSVTSSVSQVAGPVDVTLLDGPVVAVTGFADEPADRDRPRVTELIAYLTLHGHHATTAQVATAIYGRDLPDRVEARVRNLLAATRAALPTGADGAAPLTVDHDGVIDLDRSVTDDWSRVRSAIDHALELSPAQARDDLDQALSLVGTSGIFSAATTYDWVVAEGIGAIARATILDGAHHLATLALAADDLAQAERAVATGRAVDPISEVLVRDAMVIADRKGDLTAIDSSFRALERALDDLAAAEPTSETRALYDALRPAE